MGSFFQRKVIWGVRVWQLIAFLLFYSFFAFQYWLTLWYTTNGNRNIWREALIDYFLLKIPLTIPLWWLYFVYWKNKPLIFKLAMHLITGPVWVICWFHAYRFIQESRNAFYLQGDAIWWDIYIPGLVYFLQFSFFHVYDFYLQTQQQKKREAELMEMAYKSEVNALKAQIHPHFLFNTLNSISASVPVNMEHTRDLIAKLADTFRYSFTVSEKEYVTIGEELAFVKATLELESARFKQRLQVKYTIDEAVLDKQMPPMILQPIIENAVKHGIAPAVDGGCILISVEAAEGYVVFSVRDTGVGYMGDPQKELFDKGLGIKNTNLRLEKLYGEQLYISHNQPSGLVFRFRIPQSSKYE